MTPFSQEMESPATPGRFKSGEPNPLGSADLGYAERAEYSSAATLREVLARILQTKSTAVRRARDVSYHIYDSDLPKTREELANAALRLLSTVYTNKRVTKSQAARNFGDRALADRALNKLRELGVLQVEGAKRGAKWVFGDSWVYHDHEVTGA